MEGFIDFLERRAGPSLRVVSWYDGEDFGSWYVRDDLDPDAVEERVADLTERVATGWAPGSDALDELGHEQAMVQLRSAAVVLRFPTGEGQGILVSLDIDAARNLHGFVVECTEQLGAGVVAGE